MSGGHYDYKYCIIANLAEEMQNDIDNNNVPNDMGYAENLRPEVIERIQACQKLLVEAAFLSKEAEWLLSGDTGEDTFMERTDAYFKKGTDEFTL